MWPRLPDAIALDAGFPDCGVAVGACNIPWRLAVDGIVALSPLTNPPTTATKRLANTVSGAQRATR